MRCTGSRAIPGGAGTLNSIGFIYRKRGDLVQARSFYKQAVAAFREIGELFDEAQRLIHKPWPTGFAGGVFNMSTDLAVS